MTTISLSDAINQYSSRSDEELYNLIGRELLAGAIGTRQGDFAARARDWLATRHEWVRDSVCDNGSVRTAVAAKDSQALTYAIAQALLPQDARNYALYAWIATLVVRVGIERWCKGQ
jgi:hypothetical protein